MVHGFLCPSLRAGNTLLAIDGLTTFANTTVVPLSLGIPAAGTYTLDVTELATFGATRVFLRNAATASARYALVFQPAGVLATAANVLTTQTSLFPNPAYGRFTL